VKFSKSGKRLILAFAVITAFGSVSGSAAFAATAKYTGVTAQNLSLVRLKVNDTADDGFFVSGHGISNQGSDISVVNKQGPNSAVEQTIYSGTEKMIQIKACRANGGLIPMSCGSVETL